MRRKKVRMCLILLFCVLIFPFTISGQSVRPLVLRYNEPAPDWNSALPIGNGRLGAMIFGNTENELLQLNEDSLWTGAPHDYSQPDAYSYLDEIRNLLFDGNQSEAESLALENFMSNPLRQMAYQPLADLKLTFQGHTNVSNYNRDLDLMTATSTVSYTYNNTNYVREMFASYPDNAIVVKISANKPGMITFTASLDTQFSVESLRRISNNQLAVSGRVDNGETTFEVRLLASADGGSISVSGTNINISSADSATLKLVAATSYINFQDISGNPESLCNNYINNISGKSFTELKTVHVNDYQNLFNRVEVDFGNAVVNQTTDLRISEFDGSDTHLVEMLFQYGRYLLISCSRSGCQPANLQGLWNNLKDPPWECKHTININFEMNYWLAELTNLSECHFPMFDAIDDLRISGAKTAQNHYNAAGFVVHHNFDGWRGSAPINASNHGIWQTGGAWLVHHLWDHYDFTGDLDFLRDRAYPAMKESALFFVDTLVVDPRPGYGGWLISTPSNSPETGGLVAGPTMDHQIIRSLFRKVIKAGEILGVDSALRNQLNTMLGQIAPNQIGKYGQLQEWLEDIDDPDDTHRHVSHLWGLHPGNEITETGTPDLFAAARKSLEMRGDGGTGWSKVWKINFWARFGEGDHAYSLLTSAIQRNIYPNMFDAHPPFQIDGNFGVTSGIVEMLVQSHTGELVLLPALPSALNNGSAKGICARGSFELDLYWSNGALDRVEILSKKGNTCNLRYGTITDTIETQAGMTYVWTPLGTPTPTPGLPGDTNGNGTVDIIDALIIAQFYVGLNPPGFIPANADVNCSGVIDIVDALLVAQYYVGLITEFC